MDYISRFLRHLAVERALTANTVEAYRRDLRSWQRFCTGRDECDDFRPGEVTAADIRAWLASESRNGLGSTTLRRRLSALSTFFRFMMRYHGLDHNPAADVTPPKAPKPLPSFIRPAETAAMLDALEEPGEGPEEYRAMRDRLIVEMLYDTGMRCSELTDLLDSDVDTAAGRLRAIGKRRRQRVIPFGANLGRLIDDYRTKRDLRIGPTTTLLARDDGSPMDRRTVYAIVNRAMKEAGVHALRLSPHTLRHSCATDLLNSGADINSVKELLGHRSLGTTQHYTHLTYRDLQASYLKAHPRAAQHNPKQQP